MEKLFIDFDGTIISSISTYCKTYNHLFRNELNFKEANPKLVKQYNMKDECPLVDSPLYIFNQPYFFKHIEFMPDAEEVIKQLCKKYLTIICSIGTYENIALKSKFIQENMFYINDAVLIINQGCEMNKQIVNMGNSIFLDDVESNLYSTNAKTKILFGETYDWNKNWTGNRCLNWLEVANRLL